MNVDERLKTKAEESTSTHRVSGCKKNKKKASLEYCLARSIWVRVLECGWRHSILVPPGWRQGPHESSSRQSALRPRHCARIIEGMR